MWIVTTEVIHDWIIKLSAGDAVSQDKINTLSSFTWSIAEILRGDFKQSEYGKVILPFVVLRRLDCILEPTKDAVLQAAKGLPGSVDDETRDMLQPARAAQFSKRGFQVEDFVSWPGSSSR